MRKTEGLWCLEYSTEQNCFHIDLLEEILKRNMNASILKENNDYQIIYIGSQKQCEEMCETLRKVKSEDE